MGISGGIDGPHTIGRPKIGWRILMVFDRMRDPLPTANIKAIRRMRSPNQGLYHNRYYLLYCEESICFWITKKTTIVAVVFGLKRYPFIIFPL